MLFYPVFGIIVLTALLCGARIGNARVYRSYRLGFQALLIWAVLRLIPKLNQFPPSDQGKPTNLEEHCEDY